MTDYGVTGLRVEIERQVDMPPTRLWGLISDVPRIGDWSPECVYAAWLDADADADAAPRVGARFRARNEFANGIVGESTGVVTAVHRPLTFAWSVLDPDLNPARPGSTWRYELADAGEGRTLVRHSFEHGPGNTGLRMAVEEDPADAESILEARRVQLRSNMIRTLEAMTA